MAQRNNKGFWQRAAAFYNRAMRGESVVYEEICGYIKPYLTEKTDVLELACGTGLITHKLAPGVHFWEATDYSEAMLREAKKEKYGSNTHFSQQDATALPYAAETFDIVLIVNTLHLMPDPEKALSEIRRVLRPGGTLIAPTYVSDGGSRVQGVKLLASFTGLKSYSKWETADYLAFIKENHFVITEYHRIPNGSHMPVCFVSAVKDKDAG